MQYNLLRKQLPNGISLVMIPLASTEAVASFVFFGVGSRYESDTQQGLAHFTEHLVFKGGRKYTTAQSVAQAIDGVGGEFNAFTSEEFTGYFTKTAGDHLELGLDVLSDMALHASFPAEELEKEKGVIVEEINMYEDMPMRKVHHVLGTLMFGDTPLGRPILGKKSTVTAFTREDFVNYRKQFYMGSQCTVVVAGALDPAKTEALVEQYFGELPTGTKYKPVPGAIVEGSRVALETRKSEQTHLLLALPAYHHTDPRRYAYRLMTSILGGNMSSRLFTSVREQQGLCYYVRAYPDTYLDTGMLIASAGVDNNRLPQAVTAIVKELAKLRDEPVSAEELERGKQFQLGKLLLSLEDSEQLAEFYGLQDLLEGEMESLEQIETAIKAVTAEQVQEVARDLFRDDRLRLAVVGPHTDAAALDRLLTLNA